MRAQAEDASSERCVEGSVVPAGVEIPSGATAGSRKGAFFPPVCARIL